MATRTRRKGTAPPQVVASPASLGAFVRRERRVRGRTQAQLAEEAGVGRRFVIELEGGKSTVELGLTLRVLAALGAEVQVGLATPPAAGPASDLLDTVIEELR